tara:strand:+ start:2976 stop:3212 length:237 start_codon:yes stop_codon:yes gene_type:complete
MDLKQKLSELKKSTKIAMVGSVVVVAGSWGSCQLDLGEALEAAPEETAPEAPAENMEKPEAPAAEEKAQPSVEEVEGI